MDTKHIETDSYDIMVTREKFNNYNFYEFS